MATDYRRRCKSKQLLSQAIFRLKFEELYFNQLKLLKTKQIRLLKNKGHCFDKIGKYFNDFYFHHLPFELTNEQKKVIKEITCSIIKILATDLDSKKGIEAAFDKALDENDNSKITSLSIMLEIYDEAEDYLKTTLIPAFNELEKALIKKDKK